MNKKISFLRILALDTSSQNLSLAVSSDTQILRSWNRRLKKVLSSSIVPMIDQILKAAGISFTDLDGFAVGLGPGSFTSLRVGLATVKGLILATEKPVVGITSLDVLALNGFAYNLPQICTICDAKRQCVYSALFQRKGHRLIKRRKETLESMESLLAAIDRDTLFIGDGVQLYQELIKDYFQKKKDTSLKVQFAREKDWYPKAANLARLAFDRLQKKQYDDGDRLVPLYLYPKDCQVKR